MATFKFDEFPPQAPSSAVAAWLCSRSVFSQGLARCQTAFASSPEPNNYT